MLEERLAALVATAGVPLSLILFGLVGAADEYRHRTAAPAARPALVRVSRGWP